MHGLTLPYLGHGHDPESPRSGWRRRFSVTIPALGVFVVTLKLLGADISFSQGDGALFIDENGNVKISGEVEGVSFQGLGTVPIGGIIMWSGKNPPEGWALCDGETKNGLQTPDLRGRFIVGYSADPNEPDYNDPGDLSESGTQAGKDGGLKEVKLTTEQMPLHDHGFVNHYIYPFIPDKKVKFTSLRNTVLGSPAHTAKDNRSGHMHGQQGGDQPHENRPPFYVLAFIMRVQ